MEDFESNKGLNKTVQSVENVKDLEGEKKREPESGGAESIPEISKKAELLLAAENLMHKGGKYFRATTAAAMLLASSNVYGQERLSVDDLNTQAHNFAVQMGISDNQQIGNSLKSAIEYDAVGGVVVTVNGIEVPQNFYTPEQRKKLEKASEIQQAQKALAERMQELAEFEEWKKNLNK